MPSTTHVLVYEPIHPVGAELLEANCRVEYARSFEEDQLIQQAVDADAILIRAKGSVSRRIIAAAKRLKVIGRHGVGLDNIDLSTAAQRGVRVVYTPTANAQSVAEQFVGLALVLAKKIRTADAALRRGEWEVRMSLRGTELAGKTLGVVGFGRVGRETARICHNGFDMPVLYHDVVNNPEMEQQLGARRVELSELFCESDFISINVVLTDKTCGMIQADLLKLMKPTAYIINMARGPVWNERDIFQALQARQIAGAGADVFETEPPVRDHPLFGLDNFVGTPHMAAHTEESLMRMSMVAQDIVRVLAGEEPEFEVSQELYGQ